MKKNRTDPTLEISRRTLNEQFRFMARLRGSSRAYCPKCERPVQLICVADAEDLFKSTKEHLRQLADNGVLHRLHNVRAKVMFCSDSVYRYFDERTTQLLTGDAAAEILAASEHVTLEMIDSNREPK